MGGSPLPAAIPSETQDEETSQLDSQSSSDAEEEQVVKNLPNGPRPDVDNNEITHEQMLQKKVDELQRKLKEVKAANQSEKTILESHAKESMMKFKIAHENELKKMKDERDTALNRVGVRETEMENKEAENNLLRVTNTDREQEILAANQRISDLQTRLNAAEADPHAADPNQVVDSSLSVHTSEAHTAEGSISSNGDAVTQPPSI